MSFTVKGWGRWALLLVWLLWGVGCSAAPAATVAPPASPTTVVVPATRTSPPPPASVTPEPVAATASATAEPQSTAALAATIAPATATPDPALAAIYNYLEARARADVEDVTALACQTWKGQAATEAVSFRSMQARLEGVICTVNGVSGPYSLVGCTGKIITTYGTETREWDQSNFVYQAVVEDGAWKMCGYN